MKEIKLTQGQVALVDDEDFERLSKYNWAARFNKNTQSYYAQTTLIVDGSKISLQMARYIVGAGEGTNVDHGSHDTLDNRRGNLNLTTPSGNSKNKRLRNDNTSEVCGVSYDKTHGYWRARIAHDGRRVSLGHFSDKADAVAARLAANKKYGYHENHGTRIIGSGKGLGNTNSRSNSQRLSINNRSGVCGVSWHKGTKRWRTDITIKGKQVALGRFVNKADAISARQAANIKYGFHEKMRLAANGGIT